MYDVPQLRALGFTPNALGRLVRDGRFRWHFRGVYSDALAPATPRSYLWAAQLALGQRAFFSHRTAAALLGLRPIDTRRIEVTVVSGHTPRRKGLIVRRCSFAPLRAERRTTDGLRHSSATRMLFEEADRETPQELQRLLDKCAQRNLLHLDQINELAARHPHLPGAHQLIEALRYYQPSPEDKSRFERAFAGWIAQLAEHRIPKPLRNQHVGPWEMDFYWPDQKVIVETDGDPYHRTLLQRERDNRKDAWCQVNGYRIVRVTGFRFDYERSEVLSDLTALLRQG